MTPNQLLVATAEQALSAGVSLHEALDEVAADAAVHTSAAKEVVSLARAGDLQRALERLVPLGLDPLLLPVAERAPDATVEVARSLRDDDREQQALWSVRVILGWGIALGFTNAVGATLLHLFVMPVVNGVLTVSQMQDGEGSLVLLVGGVLWALAALGCAGLLLASGTRPGERLLLRGFRARRERARRLRVAAALCRADVEPAAAVALVDADVGEDEAAHLHADTLSALASYADEHAWRRLEGWVVGVRLVAVGLVGVWAFLAAGIFWSALRTVGVGP